MEISQLARRLLDIAEDSDIHTTFSKCMLVLHRHEEVCDDATLWKALPFMLLELAGLTRSKSYNADGVQRKEWREDGRLYKYDDKGMYQGLIEYLTSRALDYVTVDGVVVPHVHYDIFSEGDVRGCVCDTYLTEGVSDLSFAKFGSSVYTLQGMITHPILKRLHLQIATTFICDALFYNEDRHLNNLKVIEYPDGVELSPVFDLGASLSFTGEPNYTHYTPAPYGAKQLEWARQVLSGHSVEYNYLKFANSVNTLLPPYGVFLVRDFIERVESCAYSPYISKFVEVI